MASAERKPDLSVVLGLGEPSKGQGTPLNEDYDTEMPARFEDCCDNCFNALRKGNREAFCRALWDCIHCCLEAEEEESDEDEDNERGHEHMHDTLGGGSDEEEGGYE